MSQAPLDENAPRKQLRLLLVEDTDDDAVLITGALSRSGFDPLVTRVQTATEFTEALKHSFDVVISDQSVRSFSSRAALRLLRDRHVDTPFIVVSEMIDEQSAVALLRAGANDFVTRRNLVRLGPAVRRELDDAGAGAVQREPPGRLRTAERAVPVRQEQLLQAQKMEAVGQLAGGIAHDFNNMLTAILGYSDLVLAQIDADQAGVRADVEEIRKAGERAVDLTRQLLAFSRKQVLEPRVINLNDVVTGVERMLRRVIGENIDLRTETAPDLRYVRADPGQIEQVLINLAINARDAMPQGGSLTLETANVLVEPGPRGSDSAVTTRDGVLLAVSDTGCGMSSEIRNRAFEPFFTTKGPGKGTGLGLSMVYGVVTQSGGRITVESEPHCGTCFTIYLPAVCHEEASPGESKSAQAIGPAGRETVLVVEDDPTIRQLVCKMLTECGYHVLEAQDTWHAIAIADDPRQRIDLLVSDVVMPHCSGPDLAQRVVPRRPDMRVLYTSGFVGSLGTSLGTLSPCVDLLHKPFTPGDLARKVRHLLDRRAQAGRSPDRGAAAHR